MFTSEKVIFKHMLLGNGPEKVIAVYNFWNNKLEYDPLFPYLDQNLLPMSLRTYEDTPTRRKYRVNTRVLNHGFIITKYYMFIPSGR